MEAQKYSGDAAKAPEKPWPTWGVGGVLHTADKMPQQQNMVSPSTSSFSSSESLESAAGGTFSAPASTTSYSSFTGDTGTKPLWQRRASSACVHPSPTSFPKSREDGVRRDEEDAVAILQGLAGAAVVEPEQQQGDGHGFQVYHHQQQPYNNEQQVNSVSHAAGLVSATPSGGTQAVTTPSARAPSVGVPTYDTGAGTGNASGKGGGSKRPKRKRRRYDPEVKEYVQYNDKDVLFGRGGLINKHPGNNRYHREKKKLQAAYLKASKEEKGAISKSLIDLVHAWGGRFLKRDDSKKEIEGNKKGLWYEVHDRTAQTKAGQALCEDYTKEQRKEKRMRYAATKNEARAANIIALANKNAARGNSNGFLSLSIPSGAINGTN